MTSSQNKSPIALRADLLAVVEKNADLRASLAAIAEVIHENADKASANSLLDWQSWLEDQGYDWHVLQSFLLSLIRSHDISDQMIADIRNDTIRGVISIMEEEAPELLDSILQSVDHSVKLHGDLFGLAGGIARPPVAQSLSIKSHQRMSTREAAAESAVSRDASSISDSTARTGSDGAGEQKDYSRLFDGVRGDLKASSDSRAEFRQTRPGMAGATENPREARRDEIGRVAQDVADRVSTAREGRFMNSEGGLDDRGLEPRGDQRSAGGERDARSEMRETQPGMAGATENPREARRDEIGRVAEDVADRVSTAREGRYMNSEGGLDDRGVEPRGDQRSAGGERDARSEMRETQPGMAGATENPREARRDEIGRVAEDVADRVSTAREGRYMNSEGGLDDRGVEPRGDQRSAGGERDARSEMRETQPGMAGATENPREARRDEIGRVAEDVADRVSTAREGRYMNSEGGLDDRGVEPRGDQRSAGGERDARSEMRETQPGMAGATENPREARRDEIGRVAEDVADRVSTAREGRYMNSEGGLDDRGVEPRGDQRSAGGERDARSEMRETQPGMAGATENPSEVDRGGDSVIR